MGATESFTSTLDIGHHVGGRDVPGASGRRRAVWNPATGAVARHVALADVSEVAAAVAAAKAAFPAWADTGAACAARASCSSSTELLNKHRDDLAAMITRRARQGVLGRAGRGHPRHREWSSSPAASRSC